MLLGRNFDFLGGYLVVTARYLVVIACYLVVTGGYCSLLVVTARYRSLLLIPIFGMNETNVTFSKTLKIPDFLYINLTKRLVNQCTRVSE